MSYTPPSEEELVERLRSMARKQAHDGGLSPRPEPKTWTSREQSEALYFALTKVGNQPPPEAVGGADHDNRPLKDRWELKISDEDALNAGATNTTPSVQECDCVISDGVLVQRDRGCRMDHGR